VVLRRAFGATAPVTFERTAAGVSALVYRLRRGTGTFYLRLAEEADENLETDAVLYERLHDLGVKIARVVHVEAFSPEIGRSVLITTETAGQPLTEISDLAVGRAVIAEAGADLAVINQIAVDGFGWVTRQDSRWPLAAEHATYAAFAGSELPRPWPGALGSLFAAQELDVIEGLVLAERARPLVRACLAHGDFDLTPVFCAGGRYTGIIDFGEIRGTEPQFDLGHFLLHARKSWPAALLPSLLRGYQRITPLEPGFEEAMLHSAILLGLRQLSRWLSPARGFPLDDPAVTRRVGRVRDLLRRARPRRQDHDREGPAIGGGGDSSP
jgi:Ser/Thr protein kinase RdoA (MazF antagonist)